MARIKKQAQLSDGCTAEELSRQLQVQYQAGCDRILAALEQCIYAQRPLDGAAVPGLYVEYTLARDRITQVQREARKKRRKRKKGDSMELA